MAKPKRPLKPFKGAVWNKELGLWEGIPPKGMIQFWPKRKGESRAVWLRKPLRPVSKKRKKENELYARLKPIWRKNPRNHFCAAICKELRVKTPALPFPHHIRGRGKLLNEIRWWLPVCHACHRWIEDHRKAAKSKGWLQSRDSKTIQLETNPRKQHA